MSVINELEKYLLTEVATDEGKENISEDEDLISQGIIDSMGIMKLTDFIEKTYGITILDDDIIPDNFQTLGNLGQFIQQKLSSK